MSWEKVRANWPRKGKRVQPPAHKRSNEARFGGKRGRGTDARVGLYALKSPTDFRSTSKGKRPLPPGLGFLRR